MASSLGLVVPVGLVLLSSCGGSSTTDATETCRDFPGSFDENGLSFTCELDRGASVTLRCAAGAALRSWEYDTLSDFVREPEIPNRTRVVTRITTAGVTIGGYAQTVRWLDYDALGRVTRRTRTSGGQQGTFVLDETTYRDWDASGRPVEGEIQSGSETASLSLQYDDGLRRVDASNGESVVLDPQGNLSREVEIFGLGESAFRVEREYLVTALLRVCLP